MKRSSTATVVKHTGSHYLLSELPVWTPFTAVIRGRVRLSGSSSTNPVAVGDRVEFRADSDSADEKTPATILVNKVDIREDFIEEEMRREEGCG